MLLWVNSNIIILRAARTCFRKLPSSFINLLGHSCELVQSTAFPTAALELLHPLERTFSLGGPLPVSVYPKFEPDATESKRVIMRS
jgi:hypothetical protein